MDPKASMDNLQQAAAEIHDWLRAKSKGTGQDNLTVALKRIEEILYNVEDLKRDLDGIK